MNLWEKIKKGFQEGERELAEHPVEVIELSKMQAELNELRKDVRDNFTALGGEVYVLYTTKKLTVMEDVIKTHVKKLEQLRDELEVKEQSFNELKEKYEAQSISMSELKKLKDELDAADACLEHLVVDTTWPVIGKKLCELAFPQDILPGLIIRNGTPLIPTDDTEIMAGDQIILLGKKEGVLETLSNLQPKVKRNDRGIS